MTDLEKRIKAEMGAHFERGREALAAGLYLEFALASLRWQALNALRATPQPDPFEEVQLLGKQLQERHKAKPATIAESARYSSSAAKLPRGHDQPRLPIAAERPPEAFR